MAPPVNNQDQTLMGIIVMVVVGAAVVGLTLTYTQLRKKGKPLHDSIIKKTIGAVP